MSYTRILLFCFIACSTQFQVVAQENGMAQPKDEAVEYRIPHQLGDEVKPFALKDIAGQLRELNEVLGKKIIVLYFWNFQCPVSRVYEDRLKSVYAKYPMESVEIWVIDSNAPNTEALIKDYHSQQQLPYLILKDYSNLVADQFNATKTPEVFVIGLNKLIYYYGAVDNNHNPDKADQHYLIDAIESLLQNKTPVVSHFPAFGCAIRREAK